MKTVLFLLLTIMSTSHCLFDALSEEELENRRQISLKLLPEIADPLTTEFVLPVLRDYFLKQVANPSVEESARKVQALEEVDDVQHEEFVHWLMVTEFLKKFEAEDKGRDMTRDQLIKLLDVSTMMKFSSENVNILMREITRLELDRRGETDPEVRRKALDRYSVDQPIKTDEEILQEMKKQLNDVNSEADETAKDLDKANESAQNDNSTTEEGDSDPDNLTAEDIQELSKQYLQTQENSLQQEGESEDFDGHAGYLETPQELTQEEVDRINKQYEENMKLKDGTEAEEDVVLVEPVEEQHNEL